MLPATSEPMSRERDVRKHLSDDLARYVALYESGAGRGTTDGPTCPDNVKGPGQDRQQPHSSGMLQVLRHDGMEPGVSAGVGGSQKGASASYVPPLAPIVATGGRVH